MKTINFSEIEEICKNYYSIRDRIMRHNCLIKFNEVLSLSIPKEAKDVLAEIKFCYFKIAEKYDMLPYIQDALHDKELLYIDSLKEKESELYNHISDYMKLTLLEDAIDNICKILGDGV